MNIMDKWQRREKLRVISWCYSSSIDEYSKKCDVIFRPRSLRSDICLKSFDDAVRILFDDVLSEELAASIGRRVSWHDVFETDSDIEMDIYDKIFIVKALMGGIYSFKFERISKYLPVMIRIDLVNQKYYIMDNKRTFVLLSASYSCNIFKLLYEFHRSIVENYEHMDSKGKVALLMRNNRIIVDFTLREHTYACNSHRIIIGRNADLEVLIDFLLNGESRFIKTFFGYFVLFALNKKLTAFRFNNGYDWFVSSLKNDMMRMLNKNRISINISADSHMDIGRLLDSMSPANGRYLIDHIKSMDNVSMEWTEENGRETVCFKPVVSAGSDGYCSFFADDYIAYDNLRWGLRYFYTNNHVISMW